MAKKNNEITFGKAVNYISKIVWWWVKRFFVVTVIGCGTAYGVNQFMISTDLMYKILWGGFTVGCFALIGMCIANFIEDLVTLKNRGA